ncbi:hypothetical protein HELRODRAFT_181956 [Helobdella robusta]|uniref:Uncharacterized protein n=1 Tax=Helobdella robusta TaxID=6412 RepID=T1FHI4_HELRO|nr:hypothetical protein HELRODRAFT_181956 [Helobdella robusta]ESN91900.1 hypothetical protein HELRODRAFT_181956 [Helobdella robusta]
MVNKCCVYGCKSGYTSEKRSASEITGNRKSHDFITSSQDSKIARQRRNNKDTFLIRLKPDSVPTIFSNNSKHMLCEKTTSRSGNALRSSRSNKEMERLRELERNFMEEDSIVGRKLEDIKMKLEKEITFSTEFIIKFIDNNMVLLIVKVDEKHHLSISCSILVTPEFHLFVEVYGEAILQKNYNDLLQGKLTKFSQLLNIAARFKAISECDRPLSWDIILTNGISKIEKCLDLIDESSLDNDEIIKTISFLKEELQLI